MTEKSSLTASAVASKLDANVNFIQGPCRAAGINAFKAQCIPPAQLVVLIFPVLSDSIKIMPSQTKNATFLPHGILIDSHLKKIKIFLMIHLYSFGW